MVNKLIAILAIFIMSCTASKEQNYRSEIAKTDSLQSDTKSYFVADYNFLSDEQVYSVTPLLDRTEYTYTHKGKFNHIYIIIVYHDERSSN